MIIMIIKSDTNQLIIYQYNKNQTILKMNLSRTVRYSLYNFVKRRTSDKVGEYLPLYQSNVFHSAQTGSLSQAINTKTAEQRYKQYLPMSLLNTTGLFHVKSLVTKWEFNAEAETFRIVTLRPRGLITQQFRIDNIIPWTYADMHSASRLPEPTYPVFLDSTMVYFNKFNNQTLIFQNDGQWHQQTISHPKLSLEKTLDEKQWFDRRINE